MRDLRPVLKWSGRKDLNLRPPGPEPGALARLRYAPTIHEATGSTASVRTTRIAQPMGPCQRHSESQRAAYQPKLTSLDARSHPFSIIWVLCEEANQLYLKVNATRRQV